MEARYYDPVVGRFLSQDPVFWNMSRLPIQLADPQSWNSYAYARNNPIVLKDPDGQFWDTVIDVGFGGYHLTKTLYHGTRALEAKVSETLFNSIGRHDIAAGARADYVAQAPQAKSSAINLGIDAAATAMPLMSAPALQAGIKAQNAGVLSQLEKNVLGHGAHGKHAVRQAEWGTPPPSQTELANKINNIQNNYDIKASLQKNVLGHTRGKTYYGNIGTGEVLIKTNVGQPTFFKPKHESVKDYISNSFQRDIKRHGWSRR